MDVGSDLRIRLAARGRVSPANLNGREESDGSSTVRDFLYKVSADHREGGQLGWQSGPLEQSWCHSKLLLFMLFLDIIFIIKRIIVIVLMTLRF